MTLAESRLARRSLDKTLADVTVTRHQGVARFDSLEAWVHTDIRGWTLADLIDDEQNARLLASTQTELSDIVDRSGQVRFAAPALIATSSAA